eukprot:7157342-Alexandrium_andersonii.AAC.1
MAGPYQSMAAGWELLRQGLSIEPEQRVSTAGFTYLGCKIEKTISKLAGGRMATVATYNMEEFINSCVSRY